jgi:hypothetical protein
MPARPPRGSGRPRAAASAPAVKLTTRRLLAVLAGEGFVCSRRMLYVAADLGYIELPPRAGNQRRWSPHHLDGLRRYLRERSRSQSDEVLGGGA